MRTDSRPIGVYDSGLGGLTALRKLLQVLPGEDIIYLGDTGRIPYGTRSRETIMRYTCEGISFMQRMNIKALLVACNTISAVALDDASRDYELHMTGVVRPAVNAAVASGARALGVIGTQATIGSGIYERLLAEKGKRCVISIACPLFVPLAENGRTADGDPVTTLVANEYLSPLRGHIDTLILGCTHYPLLSGIIRDTLPGVKLISSGEVAARDIAEKVVRNGKTSGGVISYYVSDSIDDFKKHAQMYLGTPIEGRVERVELDAHTG